MKVKIRTSDIRISMPIPIRMIGFVVKLIPDIVFDDIKHYIPDVYKRQILMLSWLIHQEKGVLKSF